MSIVNNLPKKMVGIIIVIFSFMILYEISVENYLLEYTLVELISVIITLTIYNIGWNTKEYSRNNFIIFIAIGYLLVGVLTIFHLLTYKEIGVLPNINADVPTQFWIASRFFESCILLIATFYMKSKKEMNVKLILNINILIGLIIIFSIINHYFPQCFIDGQGLTLFKVLSEIIICIIFLLAGYQIWKKRDTLKRDIVTSMLFAIGFSIITELCFTLYSDLYGFYNFSGNFSLTISRIFIYISLIKGTLSYPYETLFNNVVKYNEELSHKNIELRIKDKAISSSLSGIAFLNLKGKLVYVNPAFIMFFGYDSKSDILNQKIHSFLHNEDLIEDIKHSLCKKGKWVGELNTKRKSNDIKPIYANINYVYSQNKKPICIMISFMDISNLKRTETELMMAKKDAESANLAKSYFLANMSHEIRTPLNGILGFLHLLEKTPINKKQSSYIKNIKSSTDTLLTVINDILDISKIEAGKLKLENTAFNLRDEVEHAVNLYQEKAREKHLTLQTEIANDIPNVVIGDPVRLKQVIMNLISNAIKFTNKGSVLLRARLEETKNKRHKLQFTVKDTGIGMESSALNKVFKSFTQADVSTTRKYGGTGLGLAICKSIVHLMKGKIHVKSEVGKGTEFIFSIYLKEIMKKTNDNTVQIILDPVSLTNQATLDMNQFNHLKVLLVEDNEVNRTLFTALLKTIDIRCDIAVDGEEAVKACLRKKYDLIFMDCQMPILDGYEATKHIRKLEQDKHAFIIAMTANAMKGDAEKCFNVGMDDYLSKPIDIHELEKIIKKYNDLIINKKHGLQYKTIKEELSS